MTREKKEKENLFLLKILLVFPDVCTIFLRMTTATETLLTDAVETIIATRDLCGHEGEALAQWQADNRKLSSSERAYVINLANDLWRKFQVQAGVSVPLSNEERARAYRDIEQG